MAYHIAPSLLAAPPTLRDGNFKNAIVAVAMHQDEGAMGFIINRQSNLSFHELLADLSIEAKIPDQRVFYGGPVSRSSGFILYEHEENNPVTMGLALSNTISISPSRDLLEEAAAGKLPGRFELILGYAGWGPGQIETELTQGTWLHTPLYAEVLFSVPLSERWNHVYTQIGISPFAFMNVPGGAQA